MMHTVREGDEPEPDVSRLCAIIRFVAQNDTDRILWTEHAQERMLERDITLRTALKVLRTGAGAGPVRRGRLAGEWKLRFVADVKGREKVGVWVATTMETDRIVVVTVQWEHET
jgi:hypothetical protein